MSCGKCEEKPVKGKEAEKEKKEEGKCIGCVEHYYSKLGVGIVKLKEPLKKGDKIKIKGHTTDLEEDVDSIQINHEDVGEAKKGDVIGIKVSDKVREDDAVYKVK